MIAADFRSVILLLFNNNNNIKANNNYEKFNRHICSNIIEFICLIIYYY